MSVTDSQIDIAEPKPRGYHKASIYFKSKLFQRPKTVQVFRQLWMGNGWAQTLERLQSLLRKRRFPWQKFSEARWMVVTLTACTVPENSMSLSKWQLISDSFLNNLLILFYIINILRMTKTIMTTLHKFIKACVIMIFVATHNKIRSYNIFKFIYEVFSLNWHSKEIISRNRQY